MRADHVQFGLNEIELDIVTRRLGHAPETLDQIAKTYGLTRERIRQLQVQGLRSLTQSSGFRSSREAAALSLRMKGYLTPETAITCVHEVHPELNSSTTVAVGAVVFKEFARDKSSMYGESVIRDSQIRLAVDDIQKAANEAVIQDSVCTVDHVVGLVTSSQNYLGVSRWVKEAVRDLWPILRMKAEARLAELRRNATAANLAREIIGEAGKPLHWTVVAREVNRRRTRLGLRTLSENGTHNRMQSMKDMFGYSGQGIYGLREWGPDVPFVRDLICEVLKSAGNPLTMTEIANEAGKKREVNESSLVLYLSLDPDFYLSRSGKYGLDEWLEPSPTIRTSRDFVQAINDRKKRLKSVFAKQRQ